MIHSKGKIVGAEYGSAVLKGCSVFTVQSINIQFTVMLCDTKQILDVGVGADILYRGKKDAFGNPLCFMDSPGSLL